MFEKVYAGNLRLRLWRPGPYIYYFNGECQGINKDLIKNIAKISPFYPKVIVIEIDLKEYCEYEKLSESEIMNNVFVYVNGKQQTREKNPNLRRLNKLFSFALSILRKNRKNILHKTPKIASDHENGTKLLAVKKVVLRNSYKEKLPKILRNKINRMKIHKCIKEKNFNNKRNINNVLGEQNFFDKEISTKKETESQNVYNINDILNYNSKLHESISNIDDSKVVTNQNTDFNLNLINKSSTKSLCKSECLKTQQNLDKIENNQEIQKITNFNCILYDMKNKINIDEERYQSPSSKAIELQLVNDKPNIGFINLKEFSLHDHKYTKSIDTIEINPSNQNKSNSLQFNKTDGNNKIRWPKYCLLKNDSVKKHNNYEKLDSYKTNDFNPKDISLKTIKINLLNELINLKELPNKEVNLSFTNPTVRQSISFSQSNSYSNNANDDVSSSKYEIFKRKDSILGLHQNVRKLNFKYQQFNPIYKSLYKNQQKRTL